MNILVLNGSPKGEYSITLQSVRYLQKRFPDHTMTVLHVGQRIRAYEKDFAPAMEAITRADVILFAYPVYTFLVPCQLHRFVELMKEHHVPVAGKYATQLTTSKHFYDVTAHRFIEDQCADLGMRCVRGLSADMEDLLSEKGRREAEVFFARLLWCMEHGYAEPEPPLPGPFTPVPTSAADPIPKASGDVVIVADLAPEDDALRAMIERFRAVLPLKSRLVNLRDVPLRGGCLGCFHCAVDGQCVYTDGFDTFLRESIQSASAIVYAFTLRDHSMGSLFKMYDDRQFCNGHRTVTMGSPVGYLINGPYAQETNLQMVLEGRAQVGGNPLAGIASNERDPDGQIDQLAASLAWSLAQQETRPQNFLGVGGMKIFRDLIYQMQGMMRADHCFFKAHGQYDFPQKNRGTILKMYLVGALLSSPAIRSKMGNQMNEGMIAPYRKVVDAAAALEDR